MNDILPNIQPELVDLPSLEQLQPKEPSAQKLRILLLYGSTRDPQPSSRKYRQN